MSGWYKVTLSVSEVASGKGIILQEQFSALFIAAGAPRDAGMFGSRDVMLNIYYFSPGAIGFAMPLILAFAGVECQPPTKSEVHALVSHTDTGDIPIS